MDCSLLLTSYTTESVDKYMKLKNTFAITNKQSFICNLINKLESSLWSRREEVRISIQTCSSPNLKFKNKRTWKIIQRQS